VKIYKIQADSRVKSDLKDAMDYLKSKRKGSELKFLLEYNSLLKILKTHPFFEVRYNSIHCLPFEKFKYMIHFSINEKELTVQIRAVLSTYLDPEKHWV
jgi:hypothetical protein